MIGVLFLLSSCTQNSSDTSATVYPTLKDVTDKTSCQGVPMPNATIFGTWTQNYSGDFVSVLYTFKVEATQTTVSATCTPNKAASVTVSVTVASAVAGNQLAILAENSNLSSMVIDGKTFDCEVDALVNTFTFAFAGNCLVLNNKGSLAYLIP